MKHRSPLTTTFLHNVTWMKLPYLLRDAARNDHGKTAELDTGMDDFTHPPRPMLGTDARTI